MGTTEPKTLFDKPMPELRETFIRSRFAQGDVFARPDIEKWLAQQRQARRPDDQGWKRYCEDRFVLTDATNPQLETLHTYATRFAEGPPPEHQLDELFPGEIRGFCDPFLRALHGTVSEFEAIYYGHRGGGIVVRVSGGNDWSRLHGFHGRFGQFELTYPGPHVDQELRLNRVIVDVLYAEWRYNRSKARHARARLCDALAEEIKQERAKAEADFDTAIAVSADGTKIVHADWVVVLDQARDGSQDLKFPATAFRGQKILRTGPCKGGCGFKQQVTRVTLDGSHSATVYGFFRTGAHHPGPCEAFQVGYRQITLHTRVTPPEQILIELSDGRVLLTHREQCPDPLPEGGVPIRTTD